MQGHHPHQWFSLSLSLGGVLSWKYCLLEHFALITSVEKLARCTDSSSHTWSQGGWNLGYFKIKMNRDIWREGSGSVVECLTRDRRSAGLSLTDVTALCPWARHINPSLVLVQPRKTRPFITERLLMGRKESNQTKQKRHLSVWKGIG